MPHNIQWIIPKHLVCLRIEGAILANEVQIINDTLYAEFAELNSDGLVYLIIDSQNASIGDKVFAYTKIKFQTHPSVKWALIVGDAKLVGLIISIFSKFIPVNIIFVPTIDEAYKFVANRDSHVAAYLQENSQIPSTED